MTKMNKLLILLFFATFLTVAPKSVWAECPSGKTEFSYEGPDGLTYTECVKLDKDGNATGGVMKGCKLLAMKLEEDKKCIFCPLFKTLFSAAQTMSEKSMEATATPVRNVMSLAFALYVAFMVLGHVSSLTKQDAPKFLTDFIGKTFKFLVAFILLTKHDAIYYYVINPLLATALEFGGTMLFEATSGIAECSVEGDLSGILPDVLFNNLDCFVRGVQKEIAFAQSAGSSLMCVGRKEASGVFGIWDFSMVFSGLAIYLCALLLSFAFAFYLIDSVVMLGVIGALMSFLIACWPFKVTSQYTSKGFSMFMNVFFVFVFMGIVVSINTQLIKSALETGGLSDLSASLSQNDINEAKKTLDINATGFLIVVCCCFFGFKFSAKSAQLAGNMSAGGGMDIGAKLGGLATSGAVNAGKKIGGAAAAPVVNKVKEGAGAVKDWGKSKLAQGARFITSNKPINPARQSLVQPNSFPTSPPPTGPNQTPNSEVNPQTTNLPPGTPPLANAPAYTGDAGMRDARSSLTGNLSPQQGQRDPNQNFVESSSSSGLSPEQQAQARAEQYIRNLGGQAPTGAGSTTPGPITAAPNMGGSVNRASQRLQSSLQQGVSNRVNPNNEPIMTSSQAAYGNRTVNDGLNMGSANERFDKAYNTHAQNDAAMAQAKAAYNGVNAEMVQANVAKMSSSAALEIARGTANEAAAQQTLNEAQATLDGVQQKLDEARAAFETASAAAAQSASELNVAAALRQSATSGENITTQEAVERQFNVSSDGADNYESMLKNADQILGAGPRKNNEG